MRLILAALFSVISLVPFSASVFAQAPQGGLPTVTIALKSAAEFKADIKYIMLLDKARGEAQWPKVEGILPAFIAGVDETKPVRFDILFGETRDVRVSAPIAPGKDKDFQTNVEGFAGKKGVLKGPKLWQMSGKALTLWLRIVPGGYGIVAGTQANVPNGFLPLADIQTLLQQNYDLGLSVQNTADGVKLRQDAMVGIRNELTEAVKKFPGESPEELETRRVGLVHQLDELERLFVNSKTALLGWTTDESKKEARLDLQLTALPDTPLEASIKELAAKPSLFSSVSRSDSAILFGRSNHSLDEMRRKNIGELLTLWEKQMLTSIAGKESLDETKKAGYSAAAQKGFAMLQDGTKMGVLDGYLEVRQSDAGKTLVGAIRVSDGTALSGVLQGLKDAQWPVELETAKEGDVAFHKVAIPQVGNGEFGMLFGQNSSFLIANSPQAVYYAVGPDAEAALKKAVETTGEDESKNDGTFLEFWVKAGPWFQFLDERSKVKNATLDLTKLTPEQKKAHEEGEEQRKTAIAAFADGNDTIHMTLQRKELQVLGTTVFSEGILKFVGMMICSGVAKQL